MTDIIAAIDQATGCQQCGNPLDRSVSDDFCGEGCQQAWHARRTGAPLDHWPGVGYAAFASPPPLTVWIRPDTRSLAEEFTRMSEALAVLARGMSVSATRAAEALASLSEPGEMQEARQSAMDKALEARRSRNTGPATVVRAPRSLNPRRSR